MTTSRRGLLIGVAGLAAIAWSWQRFGIEKVNLTFEPIPDLPGWQRAQAGRLTTVGGTATDAVFLGIGDDRVDPLPADQLCDTLYRSAGQGTPIAVFTDFFCPNCRVMDATLAARNDLHITWHELPLLGDNSERVARAMIAASAQNGVQDLKAQLLKAPFRPSPRTFATAAIAANLVPDQLLDDMKSGWVTDRLAETRAAAETLGIWGTPALAMGTTLVLGRLTPAQIDTLVSETAADCA